MIIQPWIMAALINTFITSFGITNYKYLTKFSKNMSVTLAQCFTITGFVAFIYLLFKRRETLELNTRNETSKLALHMGLFVVFLLLSRYLFIVSINTTPNIGYSHLIVNLNVIVTFVLGYILFNQKINSKTLWGIILCLAGLFIIIRNS